MAVARCTNPDCRRESPIPAQFMGRKVRCKVCGHEFMASASKTGSSAIKQPSRTIPAAPPLPIVARTVGATHAAEKRGSRWLFVAAVAFLLPVAAAGSVVGLLWRAAPASRFCAGIDVSSSGVTYTVFEVLPHSRHGYDYRVVLTETQSTDLKKGMDKSGQFDGAGIARTAEAIRTCCKSLIEKDQLADNGIYIVGSSGLMGSIRNNRKWPAEKKNKLIKENHATLRRAVENAVGKTMEFLEPNQEAEFQLDAVVERSHLGDGFYVDIGSGATRGAYRESDGRIQSMQLPGIGELVNRATDRAAGGFPKACAKVADQVFTPPLRKQVDNDPTFHRREYVYLNGGIVWVLATCRYPKLCAAPPEEGLYLTLTPQDLKAFTANVSAAATDARKKTGFLETFQPPVGLSSRERDFIEAEIQKMKELFPLEKQVAGAEILNRLAIELELEGKQLRFHRYGHVAWMMPYIAGQCGWKR